MVDVASCLREIGPEAAPIAARPLDAVPQTAITTLPPLRTVRMVVPCQVSGEGELLIGKGDIGTKGLRFKA